MHEGLGVEGVVPEARDHPTSGRSPYSRVHRSAKTPKASRAVTLYALPCGQSWLSELRFRRAPSFLQYWPDIDEPMTREIWNHYIPKS